MPNLEQSQEDLSRFTLPSSDAKKTDTYLPISFENDEGSFWSKKKGFFWLFIFIFILAGALAAGYFIFNKGYEKSMKAQVLPTPTIQLSSPTPTPLPVDRAKYSIIILNGSGISGEAAKMQKLLVGKSFKVGSIGNADKSNYKETVIRANKSVDAAFIDELKAAIDKEAISQSTAKSNADTDVTIIVGSGE